MRWVWQSWMRWQVMLALLGGAANAHAVVCTSVATGDWSVQTTWGAAGTGCVGAPGGIPGAADTVTIGAAHTVTVTADAAATSITIAAPTAAHGININPGFTLSVTGAVTLARPTSNFASTLAVGAGTLNAGSISLAGGANASRVAQVTVSTGTVNVSGSITFANTAAQARFVSTGVSTTNVGGNFTPGALTAGAGMGTINFNGTVAAQSMGAFTTFNNVTVANTNAAGVVTMAGNSTLAGSLTVTSGTLNKNTRTLAVAGSLAVNGAITGTSGNITLSGAGATIDGTGSITTTTGVLTITNAKTIPATANLTVASPTTLSAATTVTNNGTINKTTTTALNGANATTSIWVNTAGSTLNYAGTNAPMATGVFDVSATGNTVNYNGAAQTVEPPGGATPAYYHLALSGSGAKTMGATAVNGDFTMSGTATTAPTGALTVGGSFTIGATNIFTAGALAHSVGGNWNNSGTFTAGTGTMTFNGTAQQTLTGATIFNNLTVNNAAGIVLANDITATSAAAGVVTLTSGVVATGVNTLIVPRSCVTPSVTRTGGWVNGNLQKSIPAGASTCNFEVGDAANYTPVSTTFVAGTTAGNLTASTVGAQHPSIGDASSDLDTSRMVNRYWTLTNGGVGLPAAGYSSIFNFINPGDLTAGAIPANFEVENWSGAAWSTTTAGTRAASSTQANSLTTFGAFAVGEKKPLLAVSSISCSVPSCPATSAATVSWTVTFNRSVTGVDATDFVPAATGVSGAFVTAVVGSGTTWTVTANTGIGAGTLGLNLVDDDTVVDAGGRKLGGTGAGNGDFTGEIYPITAAPALAEYRMDEASWNGTANEVTDSGSGGFNGTAAGLTTKPTTSNASPAITGSPGTCNYGVFNRSNKDYLTLASFPNLTAAAGDFTITAWINVADNTLPGQRILIDDETNSSPGGWGFSVGETTAFGVGGLRFYYRQPSVYILDTVAIPSNQWLFVALSVRLAAGANASTAAIYAWDTAGTLLTSNTGTFTWTAGSDSGPASIGGETNASGEGTNAFGFGGNLDEIRVYQKALSLNALAAIAAQTHTCAISAPDHLEIQHASGTGLTCAASTLTVRACANADCSALYTGGVSGTLTATGAGMTVNWDGTTGGATGAGFAIPNGGSSVGKNVQVATAGSVVFGISSPSPVPTNTTTCNFGSPACTFTANTAGFLFSDTATGNTYTIPPQVSGIPTGTLYLRAVQAATTNHAVCTPAIINQTIDVTMGYACNNPATCQAGSLTTINATAIAPSGATVNLTFDGNGSAPITARYDDVGQITLNASKTITPFGGSTPVMLNGSSNSFIVKPDHFDLSGIQQTAAPNLANPAAADATGNKFVSAGEPFTVTVTAKNALGNTTKNYGQESTAESVKLTPALVGGLGLTNNPAIGGAFGAFTNGVATGTAFIWKEAGIITLTPSVADADYLGAGDVTGTTTGNVGRFFAAQFALSGGAIANRTGLGGVCAAPAGCDAFTYMGEQMSAVFNLTAKAMDGVTTLQNYNFSAMPANNFAKLDPTAAGNPLLLGAVDTGAPRTVATLDITTYGAASGNFVNGVASITAPFAVVRGTAPSGPFDALAVGVAPVDGDGAALATLDLAVNAGGAPNTHGMVGGTRARYGRMKISNAHGSELLSLPVAITAQFWNGATYVTNTPDNSSAFAATDVVFSNPQKNLALGETSVATPPALVTFASGIGAFRLSRPGAGNNGSVDMTVNIIAAYLPGNTARATFGVYKGSEEFIYLRENY